MRVGLYLGQDCPSNMKAYLDSLATREDDAAFDLIVGTDCDLPAWIRHGDAFEIHRYRMEDASGMSLISACANVVSQYVAENNVAEIRQITQPRWHAPGVLLGARRSGLRTCTRVSRSNFTEYMNSDGIARCRDYAVNNLIGKAVFLADAIYTPAYGGVEIPWWSSAERIEEPRIASPSHFYPSVEVHPELFSQDSRRVLTVGRINRKKGIDLVLDVAEELPTWEFVLVGPKRDDELVDRAEALSNVRLEGAVDYSEMPGLYAASDVLLSASRVEWGGISRAMLEAAAVGRPVVALDSGDAASVATQTVDADPQSIIDGLAEVPLPGDREEEQDVTDPSMVKTA